MSSSPDQELGPKKQIVKDIRTRLKNLDIKENDPIMAPQVDPGTAGAPMRIQTNIFGLKPPSEGQNIYQYHVFIKADLNANRTVEFTAKAKDDHLVSDRRRKCVAIMKTAFEKLPDIFGTNIYSHWYDGQAILYSTKEICVRKKDCKIEIQGVDTGIPLLDTLICQITIARTENDLFFNDEEVLNHSANNDLSKIKREYAHFMELVLNQYAIMNPDVHMSFENGKTFMVEPWNHNFSSNDCPLVGDGKRLMVGTQKSTRQIEGPKGRNYSNPCLIIDAKKAAFHEGINLIEKAQEIVGKDRPDSERSIDRLNQVLKGIFVTLTHSRRPRCVQITGVSTLTAVSANIEMPNGKMTVEKYFKEKYEIELKYPTIPLITTRERNQVNYYPMEVCKTVPGQRVTVPQQTPIESQKTTRSSAVPPSTRQQNIMKGANALNLLPVGGVQNNEYINESGLKVFPGPLMVNGRCLPGPNIQFKNSNGPYEHGQWKVPRGAKCYVSGFCKVWACYGVNALGSRMGINLKDLEEFALRFYRSLQEFGTDLSPPAEIRLLEEQELKQRMKLAQSADCQFCLFVTADSITGLHKNIKLFEREFEIITQDVKISNALKVVKENKFQTLQNIIQKTNVKLGGINYNVNFTSMGPKAREWFSPKRLIIGIAISHAPPVHREDLKSRKPSVVGFCGNFKANPQDFIGDYMFQESGREETSLSIGFIIERAFELFKQSHDGQSPEELIIYRSGVGEGSFTSILKYEIPLLRHNVDSYGGEKCKVTLIIAQKDHNVRLMLSKINPNDKPIQQNIKTGVVIDSELTHPSFKEFYLNSHNTIQGSAKTPRYTVLYDEIDMCLDELEGVTFALAHGYQIVNSAISLPAPLYIANRYAERGRDVLSAYLQSSFEEGSSDSSSSHDYHRFCDLLSLRNTRLAHFRINA